MTIHYHLFRRSTKNGKKVYHARYYDADRVELVTIGNISRKRYVIIKTESTGQATKAKAHEHARSAIAAGRIGYDDQSIVGVFAGFYAVDSPFAQDHRIRTGRDLARTTIAARRATVGKFLQWCADHQVTRLEQLTVQTLRQWFTDQCQTKDLRAANNDHQCVSTVFAFLVRHGRAASNPMLKVERAHHATSAKKAAEKAAERVIDISLASALFNRAHWNDARMRAAALVSYAVGMRISECRGLRFSAVDLDRGTVDIVEAYNHDSHAPKYASVRKGLPIGRVVIEALTEAAALYPFGTPTADDYVFPSSRTRSRPAETATLSRHLHAAAKAANLPFRPTWHSLRHSWASVTQNIIPAAVRQRALGHANAAMTDHYTHATTEDTDHLRRFADVFLEDTEGVNQ